MAPVGNFVKAFFLGLISKSKWHRSASSRDRKAKKRQVFDLNELGSSSSDQSSVDKIDDDFLGVFGSVGTLNAVFFGKLADGSQIAVKRLDTNQPKQSVEEFAAEAKILGNIRHKNLSSLCGFCANGKERLIVYHYMVNLSLYTHLHGSLSSSLVLNWPKRMSIAIGAAEGLTYLHHHQPSQSFTHGDIKSSNVLLDANFEAKWADFGLMRLMQEGYFACGGRGVVGYCPPEYSKGIGPTQQGDVFGFGILLLELISGKKPLEKLGSKKNQKSMWEWAEPLIAEGRYSELVDTRLGGRYTRDALNLVVYVAIMCAQSIPSSRLTMIEAADLLKCGNVCCSSDDL